jgi:hypothetical protein
VLTLLRTRRKGGQQDHAKQDTGEVFHMDTSERAIHGKIRHNRCSFSLSHSRRVHSGTRGMLSHVGRSASTLESVAALSFLRAGRVLVVM